MTSEQPAFRESIIKALAAVSSNTPKDQKYPALNIAQTLSSLVHITTVARINQGLRPQDRYRLPTTTDYFFMVFSFLACTLMVSIFTSLGSYALLTLSQCVVQALSSSSRMSLIRLIFIKQVAEVATKFTQFLLGLYDKYVQNTSIMLVRNFLADQIENVDDTQGFIRAKSDINAAIAHISVIINYIVFVVVFGAYALIHLDPLMVGMALAIGGLAKSFNKALSCIYKVVSERSIDINNKASTEAAELLAKDRFVNLKGLNVLYSVSERLKSLNLKLYESEWTRQVWAAIIELFSGIVKSTTENAYYLYFGAAIAKGYISPLQVIILLPYIEQVSECSAKLCNLPILSAHMRNGVSNLKYQWNSLVASDLAISDGEVFFHFTTRKIIIYSVFVSGCLPWLLPTVSAVSTKAIAVMLFIWPMTTMIWQSALTSQILIYLLTAIEYPINQIYNYATAKAKTGQQMWQVLPERKASPEHLLHQVGKKTLSFNLNDHLIAGEPIQVNQRTGGGKTSLFGFEAHKVIRSAMHVTEDTRLIENRQDKSYAICLADQYKVSHQSIYAAVDDLMKHAGENETLQTTLEEIRTKMKKPAHQAPLSKGQKETLNVIAAAQSAIDKKCEYICFDEALNGVSGDLQVIIYQYIFTKLSHTKVVIVHPNCKVQGCVQVAAEENESNCCFTRVPLVSP